MQTKCLQNCLVTSKNKETKVDEDLGVHFVLSEEQINDIAEKAAKRALELVYAEVGRNTVKAALWIIGAGMLAILTWLGTTGKIKIG